MYEDKALADEAIEAVEKEIHHDVDPDEYAKHAVVHEEARNGEINGKV